MRREIFRGSCVLPHHYSNPLQITGQNWGSFLNFTFKLLCVCQSFHYLPPHPPRTLFPRIFKSLFFSLHIPAKFGEISINKILTFWVRKITIDVSRTAHVDSNYILSDSQANSLDSKSPFSTPHCVVGKFSKNYLSDILNSTTIHTEFISLKKKTFRRWSSVL